MNAVGRKRKTLKYTFGSDEMNGHDVASGAMDAMIPQRNMPMEDETINPI